MRALISVEPFKRTCALCLEVATSAGTERLWPSIMTALPFLNKVVSMRLSPPYEEQVSILVRLKLIELFDEFGK